MMYKEKRILLNIFYIICIICYSVIVGYMFTYHVHLENGKKSFLNNFQLGLVVGALLSLVTSIVFIY